MKILVWHLHGSWTTSFVQGAHEYLLPLLPGRTAYGRGRARTWDWPAAARELSPRALHNEPVDVVVVQRPHELSLVKRWTGRTPGKDLPALYLEHDAPTGHAVTTRHPLANRSDIPLVHVTHFNRLCWDGGRAPQEVIEHGIVDPGPLYTGELARAAVVVNEARRRGRTTGTDLVERLAAEVPVDLFGMDASQVANVRAFDDVPQQRLHAELARRRVYFHPMRWTSLGLSLIEAMHLAMPVVAVATTEAPRAVPTAAGVVSADMAELTAGIRRLLADPDAAAAAGRVAREHALRHYGLSRFLADWDRMLKEVTR